MSGINDRDLSLPLDEARRLTLSSKSLPSLGLGSRRMRALASIASFEARKIRPRILLPTTCKSQSAWDAMRVRVGAGIPLTGEGAGGIVSPSTLRTAVILSARFGGQKRD